MADMYQLKVVSAEAPERDVSFEGGSLVLGRAPDCDLVINDAVLSRRHLRFFESEGALFVEDLGSSNGTYLNGRRLEAPTAVTTGDVVRASQTEVGIHPPVPKPAAEPEAEPADPPPAQPPAAQPPSANPASAGGDGVTMLRPMTELLPAEPAPAAAGDDALQRYADRLKLLTELHRALGESIAVDELLELVLDGAFEHLQPEEATVLLSSDDGLEVRAWRSVADDDAPDKVSETLVREVVERGQAALAFDLQSDERFADSKSLLASGAKSLCAAPLLYEEECFGMISLSSGLQHKSFDEEDLELLAALASVTALRLHNLILAESAAEREKLESELAFARKLQVSLLPKSLPELDGFSIAAQNDASRGVSGDYYQASGLEDEALVLIVDVCGKGMGASLLAASLEATCSALIEAGITSPADVMAGANQALYQRTPPDRFATAFMVAANANENTVRFVNGGHNPPLVIRTSGEVEELEATGFPLGMVPGAEYEIGEVTLEPGDLLAMFTDGVVEAENPSGEQFQDERFIALLKENAHRPLDEISDAVDQALLAFADGTPFHDDRTLVMLKRETG